MEYISSPQPIVSTEIERKLHKPKISCSSQGAYIPLSHPCSTGIRVRYRQLKLEILSKGNSAFVYKCCEMEVALLFIALSGFFSGLLAMSQVSEWRTAVYEALIQQGPDLDPSGPFSSTVEQVIPFKNTCNWLLGEKIASLYFCVKGSFASREHIHVCIICIYTKVCEWCMKPR